MMPCFRPLPPLQRSGGLAATASAGPAPPLAGAAAGRLTDRGCCLTFHRAVPAADWPGMPNRGFHLDLGYLERLVRYLRRTGWDVVTVDEALRRTAQPGSARFVNFSVDDCYRDTAELVVPLFRRLGAPITLYVTTGIPDGTMRLRNAGLETVLLRLETCTEGGKRFGLRTPTQKRAAFAAISREWDAGDGDAAYLRFCSRHGFDPDALDQQHAISWTMLASMRDDKLVEIGAHTVSHPRISALEPELASAELAGSRARLEHVLGRPVRHFAFPFGRSGDCGPRDFALAHEAGFVSAATTRKGLLRTGADPLRLPRNTLNGAHRRLLFARAHLSGLSGLAAWMTGRG